MKILLATAPFVPTVGNNANLVSKLIHPLRAFGAEVRLFSYCFDESEELPNSFDGVPIYWARDDKRDFTRNVLFPVISKVIDNDGFSDALISMICRREIAKVNEEYPFDLLIVTTEPFPLALMGSEIRHCNTALYIMDPPLVVTGGPTTSFRKRTTRRILNRYSCLVMTRFTYDALKGTKYFKGLQEKTILAGFPIIKYNPYNSHPQKGTEKIKLLFSGWLCSDIRSPAYFLKIVSKLDERFEVSFMGRECEELQRRFPTESKARICTYANQPYNIAMEAIKEADVLINIGNSIPVHLPSKTLEYINTGKPIINFYKFDECPTLYYTKRYPLCLNIREGEDEEKVTQAVTDFCVTNIGKTVDRAYILKEFADCTPEAITKKLLLFFSQYNL